MITSYDMYHILSNPKVKNTRPSRRETFQKTLVDPGKQLSIKARINDVPLNKKLCVFAGKSGSEKINT